jgi:hypothetical protein
MSQSEATTPRDKADRTRRREERLCKAREERHDFDRRYGLCREDYEPDDSIPDFSLNLQLKHDGDGRPRFNYPPTDDEWYEDTACDALSIPPHFRRSDDVDLGPLAWESGLYVGPPSSGKTAEAARRLKGAIHFGPELPGGYVLIDAVFVKVPKLVQRLREAQDFKTRIETPTKVLEQAMHSLHVVLDDIGVNRPTDFVLEEFYNVIDHRLDHNLPTLVTSNLTIKELASRLDARLADRLQCFGPIRLFKNAKFRTAKVTVIK